MRQQHSRNNGGKNDDSGDAAAHKISPQKRPQRCWGLLVLGKAVAEINDRSIGGCRWVANHLRVFRRCRGVAVVLCIADDVASVADDSANAMAQRVKCSATNAHRHNTEDGISRILSATRLRAAGDGSAPANYRLAN